MLGEFDGGLDPVARIAGPGAQRMVLMGFSLVAFGADALWVPGTRAV